ncbi:MAG: hypothetical protein AAF809_11700 [Bacteroidota bacterium]
MSRLLACTLLAGLLLAVVAVPAWAQPSGADLIQTTIDRYAQRMADVENYAVTQTMSMMNMSMTTYYERDPDGGPLAYTTTTYVNGQASASGPDASGDPYAALACMKSKASYAGTETIDGETTHVVRIDDMGDCAEAMGMTDGEGMPEGELSSGTMYIDTDDYVLRRMMMEGTMNADGRTADFSSTMTMSDYRTTDGLLHPWLTEMTMTGMDAMMGGEDGEDLQSQIAEMRAQMEEIPESMRGMIEDQIKMLEDSMTGDGMTMTMTVTEVTVNEGPPSQ